MIHYWEVITLSIFFTCLDTMTSILKHCGVTYHRSYSGGYQHNTGGTIRLTTNPITAQSRNVFKRALNYFRNWLQFCKDITFAAAVCDMNVCRAGMHMSRSMLIPDAHVILPGSTSHSARCALNKKTMQLSLAVLLMVCTSDCFLTSIHFCVTKQITIPWLGYGSIWPSSAVVIGRTKS
jgi:hypothetical protein